jgi:dCTP deaminase
MEFVRSTSCASAGWPRQPAPGVASVINIAVGGGAATLVACCSPIAVFNNTRYTHIDPAQQQDELTSLVEPAEGEPFVLHPGEFVLGSTLETCTLPEDLAGRLEGKSSLGRLGLLTHSTAGFIDPGFSGHITLELSNVANLPITLWPGMKIGQLCILRLTSPAEHPYGSASVGSKYQGQRGPTPSRSYLNFITST